MQVVSAGTCGSAVGGGESVIADASMRPTVPGGTPRNAPMDPSMPA